ncbi:MAG: M23 family metallopeptidase, partial [bacterium]
MRNLSVDCRVVGILSIVFLVLVMSTQAASFYPLGRSYWRSSNFGEYRSNGYIHDGADLSAPDHTPVKAVKDGDVYDINTDATKDYGVYVIVKHTDGTYSRYCHLSQDYLNPAMDYRLKVDLGENKHVVAGQIIGYSGDTGARRNYHLHFEYWDTSGKKIDPITGTSAFDGLDQPNNGNAYLHRGPRYRGGKPLGETTNGIYLVTPGTNESFDGTDDELWAMGEGGSVYIVPFPYYKPGDPIRIVVEAYDKIIDDNGNERKTKNTVPHKVSFKVTDAAGNVVTDYQGKPSEYSIDFGKTSFASVPSRAYLPVVRDTIKAFYSTTKPLSCESYPKVEDHGRIYLYWEWCPKNSGIYKLRVDVYDAYRRAGSLVEEKTDSEDVSLYLGVYEGSHLAGVAGVDDALAILHTRADPEYFSPNSTTNNLPNKS